MALKKQTTYKGIPAEYWIITQSTWNAESDNVTYTLGLFFNKASFDADVKNMLDNRTFVYSNGLTDEQVYDLIKQPSGGDVPNFFEDAETVD